MSERLGILGAVGPIFVFTFSILFFWSPFPLGPVQGEQAPKIAEIDRVGIERLLVALIYGSERLFRISEYTFISDCHSPC